MTSWQITIDCLDPGPLVRFWAEALGYEPQPPPTGFSTWNDWYLSVGVPADELDFNGDGTDRIRDPADAGPNIWFQPVPEPKATKNRLHFDVFVGGGRSTPAEERRRRVDARVAELIRIGGTPVSISDDNDHYSVLMADPEGNEFCVA
jgi:hypothetical protein